MKEALKLNFLKDIRIFCQFYNTTYAIKMYAKHVCKYFYSICHLHKFFSVVSTKSDFEQNFSQSCKGQDKVAK